MKAWLRLVAVAGLALPLMPLQWLAVKRDWRLARSLPVFFHRRVTAILGIAVHANGAPAAGRPVLMVANHVSWLDIVVLSALAPVSFVAKSEVAGWPGIGTCARLQRSVFITRQQRRQTGAAARAIGERMRGGDAMVLFAEGTTGDGIGVLPFRSALIGSAHAAMGEGGTAQVQPVALRYARRDGLPIGRSAMPAVAWAGDADLVPHLFGILAGGPIDVEVLWGEPTTLEAGDDRKALARSLEAQVRTMLDAARSAGSESRV